MKQKLGLQERSFKGVIIEESLTDTSILGEVKIIKTEVEDVTESHKTPHLKHWTLHTVEIPKERVEEVAEKIAQILDTTHNHWYADFKDSDYHYVIFRDRVFKVDRRKREEYEAVKKFGISLGIPDYQADLTSQIVT